MRILSGPITQHLAQWSPFKPDGEVSGRPPGRGFQRLTKFQ
ncbi:hypothetical protein [Nocardia gamkensis]|nr:hypothetical protein [Nocardia gamkensis]